MVAGFLITSILPAQTDNRPLLTIDGEDITVDEFMYVYNKNNSTPAEPDKKSIEEYLDLFINFKLKVLEAKKEGLDTVKAYQQELAGYRKQLAEPYFVDESVVDKLVEEAYERMKTDIRASHILVKVGPNAMPEDTLKAWNKIMEIRDRAMKGEDFAKLAREFSDDPSARDRQSPRGNRIIPGNGGDLGYFTVFDMVYPFENGAYNTPVGEISMPVRTDFGYHLIKVTDKIPAMGSITAAHIYLQMPDSATAEDSTRLREKAFDIYNQIQNGTPFDSLVVKYSDDKGSARRGGVLPQFTVNRMVPEFIEALKDLQDSGQISKPVLTSYGWHIVKLISKSGVGSFEEEKDNLKKRVEKDRRSQKSKEVILAEIRKEYGYKEHRENLKPIYEAMDSSIYKGEWKKPEEGKWNKPLITLGKEKYTQDEFLNYLATKQNIGREEGMNEYVNRKFREFSEERCRDYEDRQLETKYPEFAAIVREYHDGILLFELTNKKIWSYAGTDTTGLKNYYEEHKNEFMWGPRLDATIVTVIDTAYTDKAYSLAKEGLSGEELVQAINGDSLNAIRIEHRKFEKEDNRLIDQIKWKKGLSPLLEDKGRPAFVIVHGKVAPEPKTFEEARGLVTAGYQDYLEKEWIKELRAKYPVVIHEEVLQSITGKKG
ncbi:MAG: peptidylprolyl isomerase [Bacteroidales bacterium]